MEKVETIVEEAWDFGESSVTPGDLRTIRMMVQRLNDVTQPGVTFSQMRK